MLAFVRQIQRQDSRKNLDRQKFSFCKIIGNELRQALLIETVLVVTLCDH